MLPDSGQIRPVMVSNVLLGVLTMLVCLLIAVGVHLLVGVWGKDPRPAATVMAILLVASAAWLAGKRRYRLAELVYALVACEVLFIAGIGWFAYGGLPRLDRFFFSWFLGGSAIIAVPWVLGAVAGLRFGRRRRLGATLQREPGHRD